jgi:hypothetical protein
VYEAGKKAISPDSNKRFSFTLKPNNRQKSDLTAQIDLSDLSHCQLIYCGIINITPF